MLRLRRVLAVAVLSVAAMLPTATASAHSPACVSSYPNLLSSTQYAYWYVSGGHLYYLYVYKFVNVSTGSYHTHYCARLID